MVDAEETRLTASTETTVLLGAGAEQQEDDNGARKTSWGGYDDFEDLPWWKTPTVCC
jgi:hypothetical protein